MCGYVDGHLSQNGYRFALRDGPRIEEPLDNPPADGQSHLPPPPPSPGGAGLSLPPETHICKAARSLMDLSGSHASMSFTRGWGAGEPRPSWGEKEGGGGDFGYLADVLPRLVGIVKPTALHVIETVGKGGTLALWRTKSYSCSVEPRATPGQLHRELLQVG